MSSEQNNARKLSPAEEERRVQFEKKKKEMEEQGYVANDLTVSVLFANIMAFVYALPVVLIFAIPFFVITPDPMRDMVVFKDYGVFLIAGALLLFFVLVVVHELIHGISWAPFTKKGFRAISFGFMVQSLTPYCTCKAPLKKGQYLFGVLMPTVILGVIPCIVALFTGSVLLLFLGIIMILSGGGDLTIAVKLLTFKSPSSETVYFDHPYECGLVAFTR